MPRRRDHIPLKVKLAAALLQVRNAWGESAVPHEHAKQMTADQIISLFEWDHYPIRHEAGGPDAPWNLQPLLVRGHRTKTKRDRKAMAKERRIDGKWQDFHRAVAKGRKPPRRKSRWASRPMRRRT